MATVDSIDAHSLLQSMAPMSYDSSRLIDMACIAFAGLTIEQISALRKAYNTTVKAEKHQVLGVAPRSCVTTAFNPPEPPAERQTLFAPPTIMLALS